MGHRPGQREATEALSCARAERREKDFSAAGIILPRSGIYKGMSTDALPLPDPALLPDDPAVLKQLVVQLLEELQKANARLERQEHHMHLLLKRLYGSTSEKFDPQQGVLFDPQAGRGRDCPEHARAAARFVAGFQEPRPARPRPDSRQDPARGSRSRSFGSREGGHGRRGEPGRIAAGAERATRLAALDAVRRSSMSARNTPARSNCRRAA